MLPSPHYTCHKICNSRFTKCCAYYQICTLRFANRCACHEICTLRFASRGACHEICTYSRSRKCWIGHERFPSRLICKALCLSKTLFKKWCAGYEVWTWMQIDTIVALAWAPHGSMIGIKTVETAQGPLRAKAYQLQKNGCLYQNTSLRAVAIIFATLHSQECCICYIAHFQQVYMQ